MCLPAMNRFISTPACRADVLLDLGSGTEQDWRVPQVVMPMQPAVASSEQGCDETAAAAAAGQPLASKAQPHRPHAKESTAGNPRSTHIGPS
jgi:hypothetical protein